MRMKRQPFQNAEVTQHPYCHLQKTLQEMGVSYRSGARTSQRVKPRLKSRSFCYHQCYTDNPDVLKPQEAGGVGSCKKWKFTYSHLVLPPPGQFPAALLCPRTLTPKCKATRTQGQHARNPPEGDTAPAQLRRL